MTTLILIFTTLDGLMTHSLVKSTSSPTTPSNPPPKSPIISSFIQSLHTQLLASSDHLCFIQFTPSDTLRTCWYLVQIELDTNMSLSPPPSSYFCTFLRKHLNDVNKVDNVLRWWPDWRELHWNDDATYEYRLPIQYSPLRKVNPKKHAKFGTDVPFLSGNTSLAEPFNLLPRTSTRPATSFIDDGNWMLLADCCVNQGLNPPVLSTGTSHLIATANFFRHCL